MGVNAGEFFVNLGIKGAEGTMSIIKGARGGFEGLKESSIETKAAIIATLYALTKMVTMAGEMGTTLKNFQSVSGVVPEVLQRWQYAAEKAGVPTQSLLNSFLKMQGTAFDIRAGKGLPEWLAPIITTLAQHGQDIGSDWASKWQKDPTQAFQAFQKYALLTDIDKSTRAITLERTGLSPELVAALMRGALTPSALGKVPDFAIRTKKEVDTLSRADERLTSAGNIIGSLKDRLVAIGEIYMENKDSQRERDRIKFEKIVNTPGHKGLFGPTQNKVEIHQQINVHGSGDPTKIKKAAHDGTMDASHKIISTLSSAQTSH